MVIGTLIQWLISQVRNACETALLNTRAFGEETRMPINLGDVARDTITGFTGVVIARHQYLHGCRRFSLQPQEMKDGKPIEPQSFDEPQLELVSAKQHPTTADTGGPRNDPHYARG
jgi:hypothetical protein